MSLLQLHLPLSSFSLSSPCQLQPYLPSPHFHPEHLIFSVSLLSTHSLLFPNPYPWFYSLPPVSASRLQPPFSSPAPHSCRAPVIFFLSFSFPHLPHSNASPYSFASTLSIAASHSLPKFPTHFSALIHLPSLTPSSASHSLPRPFHPLPRLTSHSSS